MRGLAVDGEDVPRNIVAGAHSLQDRGIARGNCSELRVPIGARLGNGGDCDVVDHLPFIPAALIVDDEQRGNVSEDIVKGTRIRWIGRKPGLGFQHDADGADRG